MDPRKLKGLTARQVARAVIRKFAYRYDEMGCYEVQAAGMTRVVVEGYESSVRPGRDISSEVLANPNVGAPTLRTLREHPGSTCVVILHDGEVVASNWFLTGRVWIEELGITVDLPPGVHYSCRTYVHPDHRGRHLSGATKSAYLDATPSCRTLCALIYDWNQASVRGVTHLGWERSGTVWARRVLGVRRHGRRYGGRTA